MFDRLLVLPISMYRSTQETQPCGFFWLPKSDTASSGMYSRLEAKITGMTPAWFTFIGMYVDVPPYIRRPTIRLAYCTGMRRWACSMKTTNATTTMMTMIASSAVNVPPSW